MSYLRTLLPVAVAFGLGACAAPPPPGPNVIGLPGKGRDLAAFQQDDTACRNYALSRLSPTPAPASAPGGAAPLAPQPFGVSYAQCMVAHGDTVQPAPEQPDPAYAGVYAAYPYAYPYGYADPYVDGFYFGGFYGGDRGFYGFHDGGFHDGGFHDGGFHEGFHGGGGFFHGGGRR